MASLRTGPSAGAILLICRHVSSSGSRPLAVDQHPRDGVQRLVTGGAMDSGERTQGFVLAENLLHHDIERPAGFAPRVTDQAAQALKILGGIAQAVDVVEPQALKLSLRDQLSDQAYERR